MQIGGLQKLTLIDYPGKLACTVFCIGCSFRCPWCYNKELVLPEEIREQPKISERELFDFLRERKGLLEGVVLSGGEPCIAQDLPDFIKKIKDLGYSVKIDTNGFNPEMLEELIDKKLIDYVALDVKAPKEKYLKLIGVENNFSGSKFNFWGEKIIKNIEKSIEILKEEKIDYELRTTLVPKLLTKKDILKIVRWISPALSLRSGQVKKYFLQEFKPEKTVDPKFEKIKPYKREYLIEILRAIEPFFETCQLRA